MKIADLPPATLTIDAAVELYHSLPEVDRIAVICCPFEDVDDNGPTAEQVIRMVEHHREVIRLRGRELDKVYERIVS